MFSSNRNMTIIEQYMQSGQTFIVEFYAPWCGPCKMYGPVLHKYCKANSIPLLQLDGDQLQENNNELSEYFAQLNITAYPTTLIYIHGTQLFRVVGGDIHKVDKIIQSNS
jgi:thiol-disulfide isomerase/thioredoxin